MQVRGAMEKYPPYQSIFNRISYGESQMLDKAFYEEEVRRLCLSFEQQVYFLIRICYKSCFVLLLWTWSWKFRAILCSFMVLPFDKSFLALQFHYAVFFAYIRLREQEIRNLMWISECVAQNQKSRVHDSVVFIFWATPTAQYMLYKMPALMMAQSIAPIINLGLIIMPIPSRSMWQKEARPGVNVLFVL